MFGDAGTHNPSEWSRHFETSKAKNIKILLSETPNTNNAGLIRYFKAAGLAQYSAPTLSSYFMAFLSPVFYVYTYPLLQV